MGEVEVLREQREIEHDRLLREWEDADRRERERAGGVWSDDEKGARED